MTLLNEQFVLSVPADKATAIGTSWLDFRRRQIEQLNATENHPVY